MNSGAELRLEGIAHEFPGTGGVVAELNLAIQSGDFIALLGPSGCGKSTLLRIAAGLLRPTRGRIHAEGVASAARGFVFQESHLLPWRTVLENAALPLELLHRSREESHAAARTALAQVGLGDALEKYPSQLSGGMKMRVSVARALVAKPRLLLLDEPFSALDEITRERLQEDLRTLWERTRLTILFVTHSVAEAAFLAERALIFSPRPARLIGDRAIAFGARRGASLRQAPEFWREVGTLGSLLRSQVGDV